MCQSHPCIHRDKLQWEFGRRPHEGEGTAQNIRFLLSPFARIRFAEIAPYVIREMTALLLSLTINRINLIAYCHIEQK